MKLGTIVLVAAVALAGTAVYSQTRTSGGPAANQDIGDPSIQKRTSKQRATRIRKGVTTGRVIPNTPRPHQGAVDPASQHSTPDYDDGDS